MNTAIRLTLALAIGALLVGSSVAADVEPKPVPEPDPMDEVNACLERNVPEATAVQELRFIQWDRHGDSMTCSGVVYQGRFPDEEFPEGRRKLKLVFEKPADVHGTEFVFHQRGECADAWVYRKADRRRRRLPCSEGGGAVPCSDFTAEDFARLYRMNDPPYEKRLPDAELHDRVCYVIEAQPRRAAATAPEAAPEAAAAPAPEPEKKKERSRARGRTDRVARLSAYDLILTHVDQSSCLVLQEEGFEKTKLLKRLTADPDSIREKGGIHYAREMKMEDVIVGTHTDLEAGEPDLDCELPARLFDEKNMGQRTRIRCD